MQTRILCDLALLILRDVAGKCQMNVNPKFTAGAGEILVVAVPNGDRLASIHRRTVSLDYSSGDLLSFAANPDGQVG